MQNKQFLKCNASVVSVFLGVILIDLFIFLRFDRICLQITCNEDYMFVKSRPTSTS